MCDADVRRLEYRYDRFVHDALLAAIPNGATALIDLQTNACTFVNLGYSIADFVDQQDGYSKMSANAMYINRGIWATRMGYSCCDDVDGSAITNLLVEHGCLRPTEDRIRIKPLEFPRWFEADGIDQLFSYCYSAISSNSPLADVTKRCAGDSDALTRLARLGQLCEAIAVYRDGDIITVYFVVRTYGAPTVFAPLVHGMTIQGANFFTGARIADTSMESFCDGAHQPKLNERPIWYGNIVERGTQSAPSSKAGRAGLSVEICSHNPSNEWPIVCHKRASKILNLDTKLGVFDACIDTPRVKLDTKLAQTCHHYVSEASSVVIARTASDQDNADLSSFLLPGNRIYAITPDNRYLIPPKNETTKVNVRGKIIR
jgi:hypothetical protein